MTSFLPSGVIALFCRQYDIIKDNEPNNNKEKAKNTSENSTPEHQSGGLLRSKVRRRVGRDGHTQGNWHFPIEPLENSISILPPSIILHRKRGRVTHRLQPEAAYIGQESPNTPRLSPLASLAEPSICCGHKKYFQHLEEVSSFLSEFFSVACFAGQKGCIIIK